MKINSTPIPVEEKLEMLKQDVMPALRGDNRALGRAIVNAIRTLERGIAEVEGRQQD